MLGCECSLTVEVQEACELCEGTVGMQGSGCVGL